MNSKRVKVSDLTQIVTKGTTPTTLGHNYVSSGIRFLRAQNILNGQVIFSDDDLFIRSETNELLSRSKIQSEDVLLSIAGSVGRSAVVPKNAPLLNCNQAVAIIRLNSKILPRFFCHWLDSTDAQRQMSGASVTMTISNLSLTQIKNLQVPLPPLAEQQRIAAILDKADALRTQRRAALAKLDTLLQSTFLHMFGDPVTNPKGWEVVEFSQSPIQIIDGDRGKNYPKRDEMLETGFCLFLNTKNVSERGFRFEACQFISKHKDQLLRKGKLKRHDVVLTTRGTVGNTAYYGDDVLFNHIRINSGMVILRTKDNRLASRFLEFYISSDGFKKQVERLRSGTAQPQLPISTLKNVKIPLPPIEVQIRFVEYLAFIENIQTSSELSLSKLDNLFHALQQRAFNGRL